MGRTKRPRQTRLSFNPLPTSSPAGANAVKEHGLRSYANVEYDGSRGNKKRRKVNFEELEDNAAQLSMPTPERSSEFHSTRLSDLQVDEDSEDPIAPALSVRKRNRRAKQGKLDFSNHIGISLNSREDNIGIEEEEIGDDDEMGSKPPPRASRHLEAGLFGTQPLRQDEQDDNSEDEFPISRKGSSPLKRLRKSARSMSISHNTRASRRSGAPNFEDDHDEVAVGTTPRRTLNIDLTGAESETSGDDAPELHSSPAKKRRVSVKSNPKDSFVVLSSDESENSGSDVVAHTTPKRRRPSAQVRDPDTEDEEDEDDEPIRARKGRHHVRELTEREQEDLNEDLEFLQSSPPPSKSRPRPKKSNPRQEALEALKRKRAGLPGAPSSSHQRDAGSRDDPEPLDTSDEEEAQEMEEEYEKEAFTARRHSMFGEKDEEDEDFIVEDDENEAIGAPEVEMPLWASGFSRMKPKDLFKFAVQWLVQKKLNPGYAKAKDESFDIAFRKLDDEVRGLSGSKYISSAWTRDFTISLQGRPGVEFMELSGLRSDLELEKCDACNRSGHPATWSIQFFGKPYNPHTLEDVEQYSDSDSDSDANEEVDSKARVVPPESRIYNVGRFCKDNAMTAHALEHWKAHLYEWVVEYLKEQGHLEPAKIVKRDGMKEKKRRKYADKVVDEMLEVGQIRKLYKDFRDEIDMAREKQTGWRGRGEATF